MGPLHPPRAFLVTTTLVLVAVAAVVLTGGWDAGPAVAGVVFIGVGVALPEAYVVATDASMPRPELVERVLLVALASCGFAVGLFITDRPALVGAAAMAGVLVTEAYTASLREIESETIH